MSDFAHRIRESTLRALPRRAFLVILVALALAAMTVAVRAIDLKAGAISSMLDTLIKLCCVAG